MKTRLLAYLSWMKERKVVPHMMKWKREEALSQHKNMKVSPNGLILQISTPKEKKEP